MKRVLLASAALIAIWSTTQFAKADGILLSDPLHAAVCAGPGGTNCVSTDNGSFAPMSQFQNWGFTISGVQGGGSATGDLTLAILVPTNQINGPLSGFVLPNVTDNGGSALTQKEGSTTTLFNATTGSNQAGGLSGYLQGQNILGAGAYSPTDNFSNASAGELGPPAENPGFTGNFLAFTVTIPGILIDAQGMGAQSITNDFSFASNVPDGTVIVGFLKYTDSTGTNFVGTAASEDLVVGPQSVSVPGPIVGAGLPGLLTALFGMIGLNRYRKRRSLAA